MQILLFLNYFMVLFITNIEAINKLTKAVVINIQVLYYDGYFPQKILKIMKN